MSQAKVVYVKPANRDLLREITIPSTDADMKYVVEASQLDSFLATLSRQHQLHKCKPKLEGKDMIFDLGKKYFTEMEIAEVRRSATGKNLAGIAKAILAAMKPTTNTTTN